jgi:hypothetical protein
MSQGTTQNDRIIHAKALSPDFFKIDGRNTAEIYQETRRLADAVVFHQNDAQKSRSYWSSFFAGLDNNVLTGNYNQGEVTPHLALFIAFIKLFRYLQNDLNGLVSSHLDFFYNNVLGLEQLKPKEDQVYVFPELARNVKRYILPEKTMLLAGKDDAGKDILFSTEKETVISSVRLVRFMSVYNPESLDGTIVSVRDTNLLDPGTDLQSWHPFGLGKQGGNTYAGWAVSSPLLFLKEGIRTITLSFSGIKSEGNDLSDMQGINRSQYEVQLTTENGWFSAALSDESSFKDGALVFVLTLSEKAPAVTRFNPEFHGYNISGIQWPMLRVRLKTTTQRYYDLLHTARFDHIDLTVRCEKAPSVLLSNDYGILDAGKASQPFGFSPVVGSNLYLGLEETFGKPLISLEANMSWKGVPASFQKYYEGYEGEINSLVQDNNEFRVTASIRRNKEWKQIKDIDNQEQIPLFTQPMKFDLDDVFADVPAFSPSEHQDGLLRITLAGPEKAFGHAIYPGVLSRVNLLQAQGKIVQIPNEPYTPVIESVTISYSAAESLDIGDVKAKTIRFFHIQPFGIQPCDTGSENKEMTLSMLSDELVDSGHVYVGMDQFEPPLQLALFFKIEEESTKEKFPVRIFYTRAREWQELTQNQILSDSTLGLQQTGIITIDLPADMSASNASMPGSLHWLRFSVRKNAANFDRIADVRPNGVLCKRDLNASQSTYLLNMLPAESVKSFVPQIREVKKAAQPYVSFGGRAVEEKEERFTRISESLRHKNKAITSWDFEHLVLQRFPDIYKVKCIRHARAAVPGIAPGHVHLIVVPRIRPTDRKSILRPVAGQNLINNISRYVNSIKSPLVQADVTNASFVEIKIDASLSFKHQTEEGYYVNLLQRALQDFLSPWAFRENIEIQFGSKLYVSAVIGFIETLDYINFIQRISLYKDDELVTGQEIKLDEKSVIVSASRHLLKPVKSEDVPYQNYRGIGQMIVDINFEVQ